MSQLALDWTPRKASRAALEALTPERLREDHRKILKVLNEAGALSDDEIRMWTDVHPNAVRARRGELVTAGLVKVAGKAQRKGRAVTLWGLVERRQEGATDEHRDGV